MGMSEDRTFRIGLTMAGAISAGAYTAGVFDFLIRALAAWDEAKNNGTAPGPDHRAPIVAMTGASAGGMTAVLGAIALGRGLRPTTKVTYGGGSVECVLPGLYEAWVEQVRMVSDDGRTDLLSLDDLKDGKVRSLLNAGLLDDIRDGALRGPPPQALPPVQPPPYGFLAEPLDVYVTLTNLRGIEYDISFDPNVYRMLNHGDRKHYAISGLGSDAGARGDWSAKDPLPCLTLSGLNRPGGPAADWAEMGLAGVATGAFPVGLAARVLHAGVEDYTNRPWPIASPDNDSSDDRPISPTWPDGWAAANGRFGFVAVDGGAIDNEPFELARFAIMKDGSSLNARSADQADRAVIMVAPFPEGYGFPRMDPLDDGLVAVIKALLPTMIQQARFKPDELVAAADSTINSRFLIAPKRQGSPTVSSNDIACGLLGGFGGFLDQSFREHDFQLGQRNCQRFLSTYFLLPASNPVMGGSSGAAGQAAGPWPIIPLVDGAAKEVAEPAWPRMAMAVFETLISRIEQRAEAVVPLLTKQEVGSGLLRFAITVAWKYLPWASVKGKLMQSIRRAILADLIRRDQIEDGVTTLSEMDPGRLRNFTAPQRQILAALAGTGFDLRTVSGLARETGMSQTEVLNALGIACGVPDEAVHKVWKSDIKSSGGEEGYALYSRRPALLKSLPVVGWVVRKVTDVTID